jgi:hypothetical protein
MVACAAWKVETALLGLLLPVSALAAVAVAVASDVVKAKTVTPLSRKLFMWTPSLFQY